MQVPKWLEDALKPKSEGLALSVRLNVRITTTEHETLKALAECLNMTKTGAAEQIVRDGITEAWNAYLSTLDEQSAYELRLHLDQGIELAVRDEEAEAASEAENGARGPMETTWEVPK